MALRNVLQEALLGVGGVGLLACGGGGPLDTQTEQSGGQGGEMVQGSGGEGGMAGEGGEGGVAGEGGEGGMGGGTTIVPTENFVARTCEQKNGLDQWNPLPGLRPQVPPDFMTYGFGTFTQGMPCATALEPTQCHQKLEAFAKDHASPPPLIATRGDEVLRLMDKVTLLQFLVPIDTADEAALLVQQSGFYIGCTIESGGVKTLPTGVFEVRVRTDCKPSELLLRVKPNGEIESASSSISMCPVAVGRLPGGLCTQGTFEPGPQSLSSFLCESARLESASVPAFLILARDLSLLNAPEPLVEWALRAAGDEVKHAYSTRALAQEHGARPLNEIEVRVSPPKTLLELALENAVEGCVRETFGAAVAGYQAQTARDPQIAAAMRIIAQDETDHAALGHEIDEWVRPLLSEAERAQVEQARLQAIAALAQSLTQESAAPVHDLAGLPRPEVAVRMHESLFRQVPPPPSRFTQERSKAALASVGHLDG